MTITLFEAQRGCRTITGARVDRGEAPLLSLGRAGECNTSPRSHLLRPANNEVLQKHEEC